MSEALATKDDPKGTLSYRLARAAVIILGALLVIAFITLVVGIILKMRGHSSVGGNGATAPAKYALEPGARILSVDSQPGRVILHVRSGTGDEVDIIDVQSGQLVSQIRSASH